MSDAADLSRVTALARKGIELALKGHDARAADKFRLAAEEAETVLPGPDCLVTCALRYQQLEALVRHAWSPATPADADDALREAFVRWLPSVMAVLERRRAAGTLRAGTCRAVEEAFHMAVARHSMELQCFTHTVAAESVVPLCSRLMWASGHTSRLPSPWRTCSTTRTRGRARFCSRTSRSTRLTCSLLTLWTSWRDRGISTRG